MTYYLQSPAGEIAIFDQIASDAMAFVCGRDTVELPTADARKVWKALLLCQWQRIDQTGLTLWQRTL